MNRTLVALLPTWLAVLIVGIAASQEPKTRDSASEAAVKAIKERLAPALALSFQELHMALTLKAQEQFGGARVFAADEDRTYLGTIADSLQAESIFNPIGPFGSTVGRLSIWNEVGRYGGSIARWSPFNDLTSSPPYIVLKGKTIGRLTVNRMVPGAVDPSLLAGLFRF